jgi:hypothetical protein
MLIRCGRPGPRSRPCSARIPRSSTRRLHRLHALRPLRRFAVGHHRQARRPCFTPLLLWGTCGRSASPISQQRPILRGLPVKRRCGRRSWPRACSARPLSSPTTPGSSASGDHALCWVHAERLLHKIKIRQRRHKMASSPTAILPGAGQLAHITGMEFEVRIRLERKHAYVSLESTRP